MDIFLDTAHIPSIKKQIATGLINGVTTNPSLLSKEGPDPKAIIKEICSLLPHGDISVEVTETQPDNAFKQALQLAKIADNVVVKVPCHSQYYPIIHKLVHEGIKINVTLVFTLMQGLMMSKLGVKYISPFVGRWDDIDVDGIVLLDELRRMIDEYGYNTKILAASIRNVRHFHQAIVAGSDVITLPIEVFEKSMDHMLTDQGIAKFNADWQKLGIKIFP